MFDFIRTRSEENNRIKAGKIAALNLINTLDTKKALNTLEQDYWGKFHNVSYMRLGYTLHEHYIGGYLNGSHEPIFPEIYWESSDRVSQAIWDYFIKHLRLEFK